MIVNPQLFNYRLIIGSLVMAVVSIGTYSFIKYNSLKVNQEIIEQENRLVENELSEMIASYELMEVKNKDINKQLEKTQTKVNSILDSVQTLESNEPVIGFKKELESLKAENVAMQVIVKDLKSENNKLKREIRKLGKTEINRNSTREFKEFLGITDFTVDGVKKVTTSKVVKTKYASSAKQLHVCFNLKKNTHLSKGNKDLYIQILDPKNNIVADRGVVKFEKSSLIYTKKISVDYNNEEERICTFIKTDNNETLVRGTYFVSVYHEAVRLGNTTIELK